MLVFTRFIELVNIHAFGHPSDFYPMKRSVLDRSDRTPITLEELEELVKYTDNFNHNLKLELATRKKLNIEEGKQL